MTTPNFILLYVANPLESATFYTDLLGRGPVEASPGFALFPLEDGMMLGLWARAGVLPAAGANGTAGELAFSVDGAAAVDAMHGVWQAKGLAILQPPTDLDFGRTFLAADPDGHRLRVFAPG